MITCPGLNSWGCCVSIGEGALMTFRVVIDYGSVDQLDFVQMPHSRQLAELEIETWKQLVPGLRVTS